MVRAFTYAEPQTGDIQLQPDLAFAFSNPNSDGATNQTFRTIVKPDLWGKEMRFRFSNVFGTQSVVFNSVYVGLQSYSANLVDGTNTRITFNGKRSVLLPVGAQVYSDPIKLKWVKNADDPAVQGRNLAVSYSVLGNSGPMSVHDYGFSTSYITAAGTGDHTRDEGVDAFAYTTTAFFFLSQIDVSAAEDTVVICAFGDSITDGFGSTLNGYDNWVNGLSRRLHQAYGNKVSIVNAGISGNNVVTVGAGPNALERLDRDVLELSGLTHVIWLEGVNDMLWDGANASLIISGYLDVIGRLHARKIKVAGGTLTPVLTSPYLENAAFIEGERQQLNAYIRTSGVFDSVIEFEGATVDAQSGSLRADFAPNSTYTLKPFDYLHPNHAGYLAMAQAVDLKFFAPAKH
jgi:lysophospholipase L1-like esterase